MEGLTVETIAIVGNCQIFSVEILADISLALNNSFVGGISWTLS